MFVNKIINFFKLALIPIVTLGYSTASYGVLSIKECLEKISTDATFKDTIKDVLTGKGITNYDDDPQYQQNLLCTNKADLLKHIADKILDTCPTNLGYLFEDRERDFDIQYENYDIRFKPQQIFEHLETTIGILASRRNYDLGQKVGNNISGWANDQYNFGQNCSASNNHFRDGFNSSRFFWADNIIPGLLTSGSDAVKTENVLFFPGLVLSLENNNVYLALGNTPIDTYKAMKKAADVTHNGACSDMKYYLVMIGFNVGGYNKQITNQTKIGNANDIFDTVFFPTPYSQYNIKEVMILSEGVKASTQ